MKVICQICRAVTHVECQIEGFSITEGGFEPDGWFDPPDPPWRAAPHGGFLCSEVCEALYFGSNNVWQCGECKERFLHEGQPTECPKCGHYHCGDDQCCYGEMFRQLYREL